MGHKIPITRHLRNSTASLQEGHGHAPHVLTFEAAMPQPPETRVEGQRPVSRVSGRQAVERPR